MPLHSSLIIWANQIEIVKLTKLTLNAYCYKTPAGYRLIFKMHTTHYAYKLERRPITAYPNFQTSEIETAAAVSIL